MPDDYDLVVVDVTAPSGDRVSIGIRDGRITDVDPGRLQGSESERIDAGGRLVAENRLETARYD